MSGIDLRANRREAVIAGAAATLLPWGLAQSASAQAADVPLSAGRNQPLTLGWRFHKGEGAGFEVAGFDDSRWRVVDLPHDWSIEDLPNPSPPNRMGPFDSTAEGGGAVGHTIGGEGWYRKHFHVGDLAPGARAEILFEGVYTISDVWLNGQSIGGHVHGYTPFAFDLTPHLRRNADNVIAVRVRNLGRNSRWYAGSGLYRPVSLDVFPQSARIARWGVGAWTRRVTDRGAEIEVNTTLADVGRGLRLRTTIKSLDGAVEAQATTRAQAQVQQVLSLRQPRLWSPNIPELYTIESELLDGREIIDRNVEIFGVRVIAFNAQTGMTVNGETVKVRGACIHHDNGLLGAAVYPDAEQRRVRLLKARGFNAIRSSHYPCSRAFREACDRQGMLLIEESFDMWHVAKSPDDYSVQFREHWRDDMRAMVLSARNSPSVFMWSIGNEIPGRGTPDGARIAWELSNEARRLDPTRPVTAAIHWFAGRVASAQEGTARAGQVGKEEPVSYLFLDVPGYNYKIQDVDNDHRAYPERVVYASETYPLDAYDYTALADRAPHMIGEFVWTGMDYLGEAGVGRAGRVPMRPGATIGGREQPPPANYPWIGANCGDINLIGDQRPQSLYRDVVWGLSALELSVQLPIPQGQRELLSPWGWPLEEASWNWSVAEGTPVSVRVFTSGDRVELKLNGATVADQPVTTENKKRVEIATPYRRGVLEAVAYRNGMEIGRKRLETAGAPAQILVTAEQPAARADRNALAYVRIAVADAEGRIVPNAETPISVRLEGPVELAALGSATPFASASFQSRDAVSYQGKLLAILRATGEAGVARIEARSGALRSAAATINLA